MYQNSMPDIMILAQVDLQKIGKIALLYKIEKADNSAKYLQNFAKG